MRSILSIILILFTGIGFSQSSNDILNLMISKKTINQQEADSIRAEAAIKQQETDGGRKSFFLTAVRQVQVTCYNQIRYQTLLEKGKKDGFDIRRARLDIKGAITPFFAYRLQADFVDKPKLIDASADIKLADFFIITAGQFKIPLSAENLTSSNKLEMIDRSQVVEALVARGRDVIGNQNGRDIGVQISGSFIKVKGQNIVEYRIGVFNGSGINVADTANEAKDFAGRFLVTPLKGLSCGVAYYNGWDKAIKPDVVGKSQVRNRFGIELSFISTRHSLRGEYIKGKDGKTDRTGWYIQYGYFLIPQKFQVLAKYDTYDPNISASNNISVNYVMGANYNFNSWSRLQAFYTFRQEEGPEISNNHFSIQYQVGF
jgi:phosphate-selective porin OprO/OprP